MNTATIHPASLGSPAFLRDHGVRYAYVCGAMVKGIASVALVARMARAGLLSFYGSGGQRLEAIDAALTAIRASIPAGAPFGVNFLHNMLMPSLEDELVDLLLRHQVRVIEAAAFIDITPALVRYRCSGLSEDADGRVRARHHILGKASRIEVAERFLAPPPPALVAALLAEGRLTAQEAALAARIPLASDLCGEADSAGHTDKRVASVLIPELLRLRDAAQERHGYLARPRVGLAGGMGTPAALAAGFVLGAEFVLTGSINQCTIEADTSDAVKDLLAAAGSQDCDMAPAGDMFEIGARIQVLRKGVLFAARANRLYELYRQLASIDELDAGTRRTIEQTYFHGRSFEAVWEETKTHYARAAPAEIARAEAYPKQKMAMIFRWYYVHSNRLAMSGTPAGRVDYQIHCGPAMGAFNAWVRGTPLEPWRGRHVDAVAEALMGAAAAHLQQIVGRIALSQPERGHHV
ncbi:PfaD family polyunsaturated fatty acid/polyketide biosynthesis protein [Massilia frigida]|uniref:PfaD family polyunsaturated fatty acid/polyketide biosynthesis protein n=1 Tax=Massilia frigida TaxID=2609281 RepID=UPI001CB704B3|nr:PfaD family polyunsaturated fatty acid/polyketide biosynthesis protein [Massilia frigida]